MSPHPRPLRLLLLPALIAGLLLAGCSDDDSGDDDATTTTEADGSGGDSAAEPDEGDDAGGPEGTDDDDGDDEPTTAPEGDAATFCATIDSLDDAFEDLPDETVEDKQVQALAVVSALESLLDVAPDEVADDLQTLVDAANDFNDAIADAEDLAQIDAAEDQFLDTPETEAASDRMSDYVDASCDLDDGVTTPDGGVDGGDGAGAAPSSEG